MVLKIHQKYHIHFPIILLRAVTGLYLRQSPILELISRRCNDIRVKNRVTRETTFSELPTDLTLFKLVRVILIELWVYLCISASLSFFRSMINICICTDCHSLAQHEEIDYKGHSKQHNFSYSLLIFLYKPINLLLPLPRYHSHLYVIRANSTVVSFRIMTYP